MKLIFPIYVRLAIKILLSAGALFLVIYKIGLNELLGAFGQVEPVWLLPAAALFVVSKIVSSVRLNRFFRVIGIRLGEWQNGQLYWLGMFYNLFLPGGISGDAYKLILLRRRYEARTRNIAAALIIDRLAGVAAIGFLAAVFAAFLAPLGDLRILVSLFAPVPVAILYILFRFFFREYRPVFHQVTLLSLGVQAAQVASAWCIITGMGVGADGTAYIFVFLISSLVAILPFTVGGIGAREITFLYGAHWLALDPGKAVAISLMFYIITAFISLAGAWFVFRPPYLGPPKSLSNQDLS